MSIIQALKILEIANVPEADLAAFCELRVAVITTDKDYDVKNYAVIASSNFVNDSLDPQGADHKPCWTPGKTSISGTMPMRQ